MSWLTQFERWMGYEPKRLDSLECNLLWWAKKSPWKVRDAFEGTIIFGANGSGKTSGSGETILASFMRNGFGGLVLSMKGDEWQMCCDLADATGRRGDLIRFTTEAKAACCYNPLEHETVTENAVRLLLTLVDLGAIGQRAKDDDGFWKDELQRLLRHAIELLLTAEARIDLRQLEKVVTSTAPNLAEVESKRWQADSECWILLEKVRASTQGTPVMNMARCRDYFLRQLPGLSDKTRSIIFSMATGTLDTLLRDPIYSLLFSHSNVTPDDAIERGKIIVVDVPVLVDKEIGLLTNMIWKFCFQRAINGRKGGKNVFIFADEAQYFLTPADRLFQTSARSLRCASVYLTQNLPNLYAKLGEHETMAILGVLKTRVLHQNACIVTNKWAAETIGMAKQWRPTQSTGTNTNGGLLGAHGRSQGTSETLIYDYAVRPEKFQSLLTGGPENERKVEGYIHQSGKKLATKGKNYLRTEFKQRKNSVGMSDSEKHKHVAIRLP
jgi:hypothetical protein